MTLTTANPAPAGIYWQAVILASFGVGVEPDMSFKTVPDVGLNVSVSPQISMLPPQQFELLFGPNISIAAGTRKPAAFGLLVEPKITWIPSIAFGIGFTPSISMTGKPVVLGHQVNVAVSRASTR